MDSYLGMDVLSLEADGRLARVDTLDRGFVAVDSDVGRRDVDDVAEEEEVARDYLWTAIGRAQIWELIQFLDARRGRLAPFWLPGLEHDLTFSGNVLAGQTSIGVVDVGYTAFLFPAGGARRHLCFRRISDGVAIYRKVTGSVDNGDGTESLTIDASLGVNAGPANWQISFLRFVRLAEDVQEVPFEAPGYVSATLRIRGLPHEAPA